MAHANSEEILHHHGTSDPTDYQVDDVLVCIAEGHGLQKGELYIAQVVTRRRARDRVVTTLTVAADLRLFEVPDAEAFLRRTRVVAEVMAADGSVKLRSFQNAEELDVWAVYARVHPNRIRNKRYVEAEPSPPENCRFAAMCIPGELDDGSDAVWYVYDLALRTSDKIGTGRQSLCLAIWTARNATLVQNESDREEADHEPA